MFNETGRIGYLRQTWIVGCSNSPFLNTVYLCPHGKYCVLSDFSVYAESDMGHLTHIWVQDPIYGSFDPYLGHYFFTNFGIRVWKPK